MWIAVGRRAAIIWRQSGDAFVPATLAPRDHHRRWVSRGRNARSYVGFADASPTPQTSTVSVNAVIRAARSASASVDAAVRGGRSTSADLNAYVQAGSGLVVALDAFIQASTSKSLSVDAAVQASRPV